MLSPYTGPKDNIQTRSLRAQLYIKEAWLPRKCLHHIRKVLYAYRTHGCNTAIFSSKLLKFFADGLPRWHRISFSLCTSFDTILCPSSPISSTWSSHSSLKHDGILFDLSLCLRWLSCWAISSATIKESIRFLQHLVWHTTFPFNQTCNHVYWF